MVPDVPRVPMPSDIPWAGGAPDIEPSGVETDPSGVADRLARPWSPEDADLSADAITGPFDAFAAEVLAVGYDTSRKIVVRRSLVKWGTNDEPAAGAAPSAQAQPQTAIFEAWPFPPRHDQADYHVAVGDIVTVLSGRDGRNYFLIDELPFIAVVVKKSESETEAVIGGADLLALKVRRQAISGNPDDGGFEGATLSDLQDADSNYIEYDDVLVVAPTNVQHGYRIGDKVRVFRRGRYFFAEPGPQLFLAVIVSTGPDGEDDFGTNHYWVKEQDATVAWSSNQWTATYADRPRVHPSGYDGRFGRWVDAVNLSEAAWSHSLTTDGSVMVIVSITADPATGEAHYAFGRYHEDIKIGSVKDSEDPAGEVAPCKQARFAVDENVAQAFQFIVAQDGEDAEDAVVTLLYPPLDENGEYPPADHNLLNGDEHPDTLNKDVAVGAMVYGNDTPKWDRLDAGTEGQLMTMSGGLPAWADAAGVGAIGNHTLLNGSEHTDTVADGATTGSLVYGNATPKWDELVVGDSDDILAVNGGVPAWRSKSELGLVASETGGYGTSASGGMRCWAFHYQDDDSGTFVAHVLDNSIDWRSRGLIGEIDTAKATKAAYIASNTGGGTNLNYYYRGAGSAKGSGPWSETDGSMTAKVRVSDGSAGENAGDLMLDIDNNEGAVTDFSGTVMMMFTPQMQSGDFTEYTNTP